MSKKCYVCGKKPSVGHKVSHSNRKTKIRWFPNLQNIRILIGKTAKKVLVCTSCIKRGKIRKAA